MIRKDKKIIELNVKKSGLVTRGSRLDILFAGAAVRCLFAGFIACFVLVSGSFAADSNDFSTSQEPSDRAASADVNAVQVQDLNLKSKDAIVFQYEEGRHILVFQDGFTMTANRTEFTSDKAVVWLVRSAWNSPGNINYTMIGYLEGKVRVRRDGRATPTIHDERMAVLFQVTGEVLVTAKKKVTSDPRGMKLYTTAYDTLQSADIGPVGEKARPVLQGENRLRQAPPSRGGVSVVQAGELGDKEKEEKPKFRYPITLQPISEKGFEIEEVNDNIATVMGGFYLSQKQEFDGKTLLLEMQADNAAIFLAGPDELNRAETKSDTNEPNDTMSHFEKILAAGTINAIYLSGDVIVTEGQRTMRADEVYYDYKNHKAIIINAVMRNFEINTGIPIYIRASKLQQLAANKFSANNAVLTTSEFYIPQLSLSASSIIVIDNTSIDQEKGDETRNSYEVEMRDVSLNYYDIKFPLFFPKISANMERPDTPLKDIRVGNDNILGTYVETSWFTTRFLVLRSLKEQIVLFSGLLR